MIGIVFRKWDTKADNLFIYERLYYKNKRTIFCKIKLRYWKTSCAEKGDNISMLNEKYNYVPPTAAIYGFCAWLTTREKRTILSNHDNSGIIADLIIKYSRVNNFELGENISVSIQSLQMPKE